MTIQPHKIALFCFFSLIIIQTSCSGQSAYHLMLKGLYKDTVPLVSVDSLKRMMEEDTTIILLDSRAQEEFAVSHIKSALWVGYESFDLKKIKDIPRDAKLVVYCSVGYRSERIGEQLLEAGFSQVFNLSGGIFEWVNEGMPVIDSTGASTKKVHAYNKSWGLWLKKAEKVY
jgi:rhodanese-related sulfurtransferase